MRVLLNYRVSSKWKQITWIHMKWHVSHCSQLTIKMHTIPPSSCILPLNGILPSCINSITPVIKNNCHRRVNRDFFQPHRKRCELVNGQIHHVFRCRSFVATVVTNFNSASLALQKYCVVFGSGPSQPYTQTSPRPKPNAIRNKRTNALLWR